jgi:hypothetical protein
LHLDGLHSGEAMPGIGWERTKSTKNRIDEELLIDLRENSKKRKNFDVRNDYLLIDLSARILVVATKMF